ncbi:ATP-binding protein [Novosphingobium sp.]|uniref:sensor histidine kinase n=1 Tax=Novosphingobium sp. TaxID=1874826 RepID=UPI0025FBA94A|nr:ATP-binding protein [Novosphingobium sp.]
MMIQRNFENEAAERIDGLRTELIHVARLSAMATMASTLAHELNQPIAAIMNYLEGARELLGQGHLPVADALDQAMVETVRAGSILSELRGFVQNGEAATANECLSSLIEDALMLGVAGAHIAISCHFAKECDLVLVDRARIQLVIVNLVHNAIAALDGQPDPQITIRTRSDNPVFACVTIIDTGFGVPADIVDPFRAFSARNGRGFGLGLPVSRTIVEAHGGRIWFESVPGAGSAFHFTLPKANQPEPSILLG